MKLLSRYDMTNALSLIVIQGSNAVFPILIFPVLLYVVGAESFSSIVLAEAVVLIILAIALYGLDVVAIDEIITKVREGESPEDVYFEVICARLIIFTFSFSITLCAVWFFFEGLQDYLLAWAFFPIGMIFQSNYYYQATGENLSLAICVVLSRLFSCAIFFYLVHYNAGAFFLVLSVSTSYFFSGLCSFLFFLWKKQAPVHWGVVLGAVTLIKRGWRVCASNLAVVFYRGIGVIALSAITGDSSAVSVYALAEKYVKFIQAVFLPVSQFFVPRVISSLRERSMKRGAVGVVWESVKIQISLSLLTVFLVFSLVGLDVFIFKFISDFRFYVLIMIMVCVLPLGLANYMFGMVGLIALGGERYLLKIMTYLSLLAIVANIVAAYYASSLGVAIVFVGSEALLLLTIIFYFLFLDDSARGSV